VIERVVAESVRVRYPEARCAVGRVVPERVVPERVVPEQPHLRPLGESALVEQGLDVNDVRGVQRDQEVVVGKLFRGQLLGPVSAAVVPPSG